MNDTSFNNLRYYMDETSAPYEDGECPFVRTENDDQFDAYLIKKYGLILKNKENIV